MRRAVITTTIYRPANLLDWAHHMRAEDIMVVSGDEKTPHDEVREVLDFISDVAGVETSYVVETDTRTSRAVPMRSIQRRNVAVLEAMRIGADIITTVDTDNYPLNDGSGLGFAQLDDVERLLTRPWDDRVVGSSTGWSNAGEWCDPPVIHRGWPLGVESGHVNHVHDGDLRVGVHASLWKGDPDVSALERLLHDPEVLLVPDYAVALEPGVWCPFNSQATSYGPDVLPLLNVWPGVGRMDDIWPSYVARRVLDHLDYLVAYGAPNVRQERHEHDVVTDLENEIIGYRHTGALLEEIVSTGLGGIYDALDALEEVLKTLRASRRLADVIPPVTRDFWTAWVADLRELREEKR